MSSINLFQAYTKKFSAHIIWNRKNFITFQRPIAIFVLFAQDVPPRCRRTYNGVLAWDTLRNALFSRQKGKRLSRTQPKNKRSICCPRKGRHRKCNTTHRFASPGIWTVAAERIIFALRDARNLKSPNLEGRTADATPEI